MSWASAGVLVGGDGTVDLMSGEADLEQRLDS